MIKIIVYSMSVIVFCNSSMLNASQSAGAGILTAPKNNSAPTALAASRALIHKKIDKANAKPEAKNTHEFMQRDYKKLWPITLGPYPKTEKIKPKTEPLVMPDGSILDIGPIDFPPQIHWEVLSPNGKIKMTNTGFSHDNRSIETSVLTHDEKGNIIFVPGADSLKDELTLPAHFIGNKLCMHIGGTGSSVYSVSFDEQNNKVGYKKLFADPHAAAIGLNPDSTLYWVRVGKPDRTLLYTLRTAPDEHLEPSATPVLDIPGKHTIAFSPDSSVVLACNDTQIAGYLKKNDTLIPFAPIRSADAGISVSFGANNTVVQSGVDKAKSTQIYSLKLDFEKRVLSLIPLLSKPLSGSNARLSHDNKLLWLITGEGVGTCTGKKAHMNPDEKMQLYSLKYDADHAASSPITPILINEWALEKVDYCAMTHYYTQDSKYVIIGCDAQTLVLDFNTGELCARLAGLPRHITDRFVVAEAEDEPEDGSIKSVNYDLQALQVLPKVQETVFPTILPFSALKELLEFIAGPQPEYIQRLPMQEQTSKEEKDLQDTIAHYQTLANEKRIHADKAALFAAIVPEQTNPDAIDRYVTYFTINATDEDFNTPLLKAIRCESMPIIEKLLNWNTTIAVDRYCRNTVAVNLEQADQGQKAIELAIEQNKFTIACRIARNIKTATLLQMKNRILKLLEAKAGLNSDEGYQNLKEKFEKIN